MKTLLEQAKEIKTNARDLNITEEEKDLVLAYLREEINSVQLRRVLNKDGVQIYSFIVRATRELIKDQRISVWRETKE
jgi:hypothetical protein